MFQIILIVSLIFILYRWLTGTRSDSVCCLVGKTAIVTGGNGGIGFAIVLLLASRGCRVIIADKTNAEASVKKIKQLSKNSNIIAKHLDLSSFASIRKFAEDINISEKKIHILINNAGINSSNDYRTEDGISSAMQVNYLGPFLLTHLLVDRLKEAEGARVVFVGSVLALFNNLSVENLTGFDPSKEVFWLNILYGNSKAGNILAAQEFGKKLKKYNIAAFAADPGINRTNIFDVKDETLLYKVVRMVILWIAGHKPIVGAQTAFHLATSDEMEGTTGGYYFQCKRWIKPWKMNDPDFCEQIWKKSEILVKLNPHEIL
ncbi:retinol dehydrogenase 12-like [Harmonia axyridis]|uniref:retinol dehydrogenase 12-like n=1 Tax=Harmonia axyridis TaxID=115357 RepID=UPI001E27670F|nr:retinol dehydrogenase 12-like [Harmonia axyridis]